jgi:formylglycine-generating enzyme required for sulfatase activity
MGSPETEANHLADGRETRRMCTLTNDFYIGIYPMTFRQYGLLSDSTSADTRLTPVYNQVYNMLRYNAGNPSGAPSIDFPNTGRTQIGDSSLLKAWRDKTGLVLDLPTSAQWEYACRGGTDTPIYNGTLANLSSICNTSGSHYEVGQYAANSWQLYDTIGNVFEWCLDYYEDGISSDAVTDPLGPVSQSSGYRKIRGQHSSTDHKRAAFVTSKGQRDLTSNVGFRLCITLP